jgi:hypothetical protein
VLTAAVAGVLCIPATSLGDAPSRRQRAGFASGYRRRVAIEIRLDDLDELHGVVARGEDVRMDRVSEDHWFIRIGRPRKDQLVIHLQTAPGSSEIRAWFSRELGRT